MTLTIAELVEQSGVAARTIREYIRLELLPRPTGVGPAALYAREHLLRLWVIAEGRRQGVRLVDLKPELEKMSPRDMARYRPAKPKGDVAPPSPPAPAAPPPTPTPPSTAPPRLEAAANDDQALAPEQALPGRRYSLVPLLPGLVLMVDEDAARIVRRAALEIIERYGAGAGAS